MSVLSLLLPYVNLSEVTSGFLMDEMKYLTALAVRDYYFSTQRTSTIALAAIFGVLHDTTTRLQDLLGPFLRVIIELFDFDRPMQIEAARVRLQSLAKKPSALIEEGEDDVDERSLDDSVSVKTLKVSNKSAQKRDRDRDSEGEFSYETDELNLDNVHEVSPSSTLCHLDQDLHRSLYLC